MEEKKKQSLYTLTRAYYDYQRERMSLDGQIGRKKNGEVKKGVPERDEEMLLLLMARRKEVEEMENVLFKEIAKEVHLHALWKEYLVHVKGCGEAMAAVILTQFDINKSVTVSNMWSFAGLAPGKDRKVKKKTCSYNQFLRAKLCGVLAGSFLRSFSPYCEYYYNIKNRYISQNWGMDSPNPTDKKKPKAGHQDRASKRYMIKMFLKDLYVAWRTLEGLPVRAPYQEEYLGHVHGVK